MITWWLLRLLAWGLGIRVAAHLVTDLRPIGSPGERLLTAAVVAAVSDALLVPTLIGLGRVNRRVQRWASSRLDENGYDDRTLPVLVLTPVAVAPALNLVLALAPLALWVATAVAHAAGLPSPAAGVDHGPAAAAPHGRRPGSRGGPGRRALAGRAAAARVAMGLGALVRLLLLGRPPQRDEAAEALRLHGWRWTRCPPDPRCTERHPRPGITGWSGGSRGRGSVVNAMPAG